MPMLMYKEKVDAQRQKSCRNVTFVMRKFSVSLPVLAMIVKQGKHFTTAKIFKKVCKSKTLFVTVTILSPNLLLNDCCFKIIVDRPNITENFHMTKQSSKLGWSCGPSLPELLADRQIVLGGGLL